VLSVREHGFDAAAVLALQAVDCVEPFFDDGETAGVRLEPLEVVAQLAGDVAKLERERTEPSGERREAPVDASDPTAPPPSSSAPSAAA
jgi:hypothetical protein